MYKTSNGTLKTTLNELMKYAIVSDLSYNFMFENGKVNGELCDDVFEFIDNYIDKPETLSLILDENKQAFLYEIADSNRKPASWTPEKYYEAYKQAVELIYNKEPVIPCIEIELILMQAAEEIASIMKDDDGFDKKEYEEHLSKIKDIESFKTAAKEMLETCYINKDIIPTCVNELVDEISSILEEFGNLDPDDVEYWSEEDACKDTFENFLFSDVFEGSFFYDLDALLLLKDQNDEQIEMSI